MITFVHEWMLAKWNPATNHQVPLCVSVIPTSIGFVYNFGIAGADIRIFNKTVHLLYTFILSVF